MTMPSLPISPEIQNVLDYDRTEFRFPGVYMISFKAWLVQKSIFHPEGVRYSFNLFIPDADGVPNHPVLRFDNEHAPPGIKAPYDHWHPSKRGPGGKIIGTDKEIPQTTRLAELPYLFLQKSYELLKELGVDVDQGVTTQAPQRNIGSVPESNTFDVGATTNQRKRSK